MADKTDSRRIDIRVSGQLFSWVDSQAKAKGFRTRSEFIRYVLESLRLKDRKKLL